MQTRPSWSFDGSQESSLERKIELTSVCFCPTWTKARRGWLKNLGIERALGSALVFRETQTGQCAAAQVRTSLCHDRVTKNRSEITTDISPEEHSWVVRHDTTTM